MSNTENFTVADLPQGDRKPALTTPHFPTRQQAFIWRNWEMVPVERLATILGATAQQVEELASGMDLPVPPRVSPRWDSHGYMTLIRRNWHLLNYEQLLQLLQWTAPQLEHALREDDFLWIKLGLIKPDAEPLRYTPLTEEEQARTTEIRSIITTHFGADEEEAAEPFAFLEMLDSAETPARREWATRRDGDLVLDAQWQITGAEADPLSYFAETFVANHAARWGETLQIGGGQSGSSISLRVEANGDLPRESHSIEIGENGIEIVGVDAVGVLRGLQWIEAAMQDRGGPFLTAGKHERRTRLDYRLIYPYCGLYGDALLDPDADPLPHGLLSRLSSLGVNGVWLQGLLSQLYPWDLAPEMSEGWEKRLENLRKLTEKAATYGIKIFLYMNEPRALPLRMYETHPQFQPLKGIEFPELTIGTLCTSTPEILSFLRESSAHVFKHVPQLGGFFTITMSENPTNCHSHGRASECPRCGRRTAAEVIGELNTAIAEGIWQSQPDARFTAWNWGGAWPVETVDHMPPGVQLQAVSEEANPTHVGGVEGEVLDYTMSQFGPGPKAKALWKYARERGRATCAKMQINNTWECSAFPYIPVPHLVDEHIRRALAEGVTGMQLGWTLGGFPGGNLALAAGHYWDDVNGAEASEEESTQAPGAAVADLARRQFGEAAAPAVEKAWRAFSDAFLEFPFHVSVVYAAPMNYGPMNLLHSKSTGYSATMLGMPYDDLEAWRAIYPADVFENQFKLLTEKWHEGFAHMAEARRILESAGGESTPETLANFDDLERIARGNYIHFKSTYLQILFIRTRDALATTEGGGEGTLLARLQDILAEEIYLAREMYVLAGKDARFGYEASNHYYYTRNDLREKVLNCEELRRFFVAENMEQIRASAGERATGGSWFAEAAVVNQQTA